jgi:hypothetical protein
MKTCAEALSIIRASLHDAERIIDALADQAPGAFYADDCRPLIARARRVQRELDRGEPMARALIFS